VVALVFVVLLVLADATLVYGWLLCAWGLAQLTMLHPGRALTGGRAVVHLHV